MSSIRITGRVIKYGCVALACVLLIVPIVVMLVSCPEAAGGVCELLQGVFQLAELFGNTPGNKGSDQKLG